MINKEMEHLLQEGLAIDCSEFPRGDHGEYLLDSYVPNCQYCDATTEEWIVSIGCQIETMQIVASTTAEFYKRPGYQCLFLR
jgi:hypothetical protein